MADDIINGNTPDLSSILGELLSNKELMDKIGEIAGNSKPQENTNTEGTTSPTSATPADSTNAPQTSIDSLLSNPDIMSKLPEVISVIKPLMSGKAEEKSHPAFDKRLALLIALKPYLSPKRCEAIDYITKMSKLSETFKGLKL